MIRRAISIGVLVVVVLAGIACGEDPAEIDPTAPVLSDAGHFRILARSEEQPIPVNRMHDWRVRIETPDGEPVVGALLSFDGDMPEHGHGLPTRPRVVGESEPGVYALEGVRFSMPGYWELYISVLADDVADTATLERTLR